MTARQYRRRAVAAAQPRSAAPRDRFRMWARTPATLQRASAISATTARHLQQSWRVQVLPLGPETVIPAASQVGRLEAGRRWRTRVRT